MLHWAGSSAPLYPHVHMSVGAQDTWNKHIYWSQDPVSGGGLRQYILWFRFYFFFWFGFFSFRLMKLRLPWFCFWFWFLLIISMSDHRKRGGWRQVLSHLTGPSEGLMPEVEQKNVAKTKESFTPFQHTGPSPSLSQPARSPARMEMCLG